MLDHFHATVTNVKDLSSDADAWRAVLKMRAALRAGLGRMNDDLIRLRDLPKCRAAMTELTAGLASRLLSKASGTRNFLPGRIKRWRQGRVVRVALNRLPVATLDLMLQLAEASEEVMVQLTFCEQFL